MYFVTALDMQDRLIRMVGGRADEAMVTDCRLAIRQALRTVSAEFIWSYYHDYLNLTTHDLFTDGSISYDPSTSIITLTGATWPSWINYGVFILGTGSVPHVRVDTVIDSTHVKINPDDYFPDAYSGSYQAYQYQFTLPLDYNIYRIGKIQIDRASWCEYVPPGIFETDVRRQWLTTGGRPRWFTVSRDSRNVGQTLLALWPYPTIEFRCRFGFFRHPKDILTWDETTGQVATTASSQALVGTNTRFSQTHKGAILRTYSDRINPPTSRDGTYPPIDEVKITAVTDANNITISPAATTTQSDVAYTISDPIDVDNTVMLEVVAYAARLELAKIRRMEKDTRPQYEADYKQALYLAKSASGRDNSVKIAGSFHRSNIGWPGIFNSYYSLQ